MPTKSQLYSWDQVGRDKQRFASGWRHLEHPEPVGEFKMLALRNVPSDDHETASYRTVVVAPRGIPKRAAARALTRTLAENYTDSCSHSYDCCGCTSAFVSLRHLKGRSFSALIELSRNY